MKCSHSASASIKVAFCCALAFGPPSAQAQEARADAMSLDNGERIYVAYYIKIEHRPRNVIENFVYQLIATRQGRDVLGALASIAGVNPVLATVITKAVPLPSYNMGVTDNRGIYRSPEGMTICKAGPIGNLEVSHAAWSTEILRDKDNNGLGYYTSVGTGQDHTHRVQGTFYIEFVKPADDWEHKWGCMPVRSRPWALHDK